MPGLKPKASAGARRNANRARCQFAECDKFAQTRGLCKAHGGGSRCRDPDCNKLAQSRGLCIAHGGGRRCQFDGCAKLAQSKGYCMSHSKLLAAASSPSSSAPNSPLASPTACAMTPPPCGLADAAMSPTKSKLSIGFLVNPSFAGVAEQPKRAPLPSFSSSLARYDQWRPQASANALPSHFSVFEPPRSLLSFLEPAQAERIRPTTVLPPLALYH
jgi:hypothetical protein